MSSEPGLARARAQLADEPLALDRLAKLANASKGDVSTALESLKSRLKQGIVLVRTETTAALAVAPGLEPTCWRVSGRSCLPKHW